MNDDRSKPQTADGSETADALPSAVNPQVTDAVETSTHTKLGAIPSSYGEAGGMGGQDEPTDGEPLGDA